MFAFAFESLSTRWQILVDQPKMPDHVRVSIIKICEDFEKKYSRFLPESEINQIGAGGEEKVKVSLDLAKMLNFGLVLRKLTHGAFEPNIAAVLTSYGYDEKYSFQKKKLPMELGSFELSGPTLFKKGLVKLDLGAFGKGYLIDLIAVFLEKKGIKHFLINGGGDIFATDKTDGSPWRVVIEHPLDPNLAIGQIDLKNRALATSSSQKRKFGEFRHLIDFRTKLPAESVLSVSVLASTSMVADGVASAIFVGSASDWPRIVKSQGVEYLILFPDLSFQRSENFPQPY